MRFAFKLVIVAGLFLFGFRSLGTFLKLEQGELKAIPKPIVTLESLKTFENKKKTSPEPTDFGAKVQKAFLELARHQDIEGLSDEELHHTPLPVLRSAERIGEIETLLEKDPALGEQGVRFFRRCAENDDIEISLRAVCHSRFVTWTKKLGLSNSIQVGDEVLKISKNLHPK